MGDKKRRAERFRQRHPKCCFCGGLYETEEIDHVPPKIIFVGSQIPPGSDIEFPACEPCNRNSRQYDQIAAMLALTSPRQASEDERAHFLKAVRGVRNNARGAIEEINRGFPGWRHAGKEFSKRTGVPAHAAEMGPIARKAMFVLSAKLALAYYFRETGKILPPAGAVVVDMVTNSKILSDEVPENYRLSTAFRALSRNDHREQFLFRYQLIDDGSAGMFQFALQLNFMLVAIVVEDRKSHPIDPNSERTFVPGFLKSLPAPSAGFSTSASIAMSSSSSIRT